MGDDARCIALEALTGIAKDPKLACRACRAGRVDADMLCVGNSAMLARWLAAGGDPVTAGRRRGIKPAMFFGLLAELVGGGGWMGILRLRQ